MEKTVIDQITTGTCRYIQHIHAAASGPGLSPESAQASS